MDLAEAERAIAVTLSLLEKETGSVVRSVGVEDIDVTRLSSERRTYDRRVVIELERLPGTNWGQAQ